MKRIPIPTEPFSPDASNPLVSVEDVSYAYPADTAAPDVSAVGEAARAPLALDHLSLTIGVGESVAILGHNGSGKSTLSRLLNGLRLPDSGRVRVAGMDTRDPACRARIRASVGMIFSDPDNQIVATVVEDDVAWGLAARGYPRAEIARRVEVALAAVGLSDVRMRPPNELSGGQRQRLAIAGALALQPACLIADEPTALLDPRGRAEMVDLLTDLRRTQGLTLVYVTHLLEEAVVADRIIVLERGRIALEGPPAALFADLERLRALRLHIPDVTRLGERLRAAGIAVSAAAMRPEALLDAIETRSKVTREGSDAL